MRHLVSSFGRVQTLADPARFEIWLNVSKTLGRRLEAALVENLSGLSTLYEVRVMLSGKYTAHFANVRLDGEDKWAQSMRLSEALRADMLLASPGDTFRIRGG